MKRLALSLAAAALAFAAPDARAAWFGAEPVDAGTFGGLDVARDGTGALAYVKPDGVYVTRLRDGAWQPPERVVEDAAATDPVVAVADGGALAVAWRSGGRVLGAFAADGAPLSAPAALGGDGTAGPPAIDMAIQRTAYVTFAAGGNVVAVRLKRGTWEAVGGPLDVDPARPAGDGAGRPRVAVAADGNALVVWGERPADGRLRLYGRRLIGLRPSAFPQEISVAELGGAAAGDADGADVAVPWDSSYAWVAWRQDVGGVSRVLARRLVGSRFEAPSLLDGGAAGRGPRVSLNGKGLGIAVAATDAGGVLTALANRNAFSAPAAVGSGTQPLVSVSDSRDVAIAWQTAGGLVGRRAARGAAFEPAVALGAGGGAAVLAADRGGDFMLGFQRENQVVTAVWDKPPSAASPSGTRAYRATSRPVLRWSAGRELWGPQTFRVLVDGKEVGRTTATSLRPRVPLADGPHRWQVLSVDRRGQTTRSRVRDVRVDATGPKVRVRVQGRAVQVRISDPYTGVATARVAFGDGAVATTPSGATHHYPRAGSFTVEVRATDGLGNITRQRTRVRVR